MRWIVRTSLKYRYLVVYTVLALLILSIYRLRDAPVDVFPEFAPPKVEIQTPCLGLSTAAVEQLVTVPLEQALNGIHGIDVMRSKSVPDLSSIVLIFKPGTDLIHARQLVQERIATVITTLPTWACPPFLIQPLSSTSRVMKMRAGDAGQASDRLGQDLLFFCAQAALSADRRGGPALSAARVAYQVDGERPVDYERASLGLFDPALVTQARKRVASAKDGWSAVAAGERARLSGLTEPFSLVAESLERLYPGGAALGAALLEAAGQCQSTGSAPPAALAMEVATALLYLDASLEDAEFDHPKLAARVGRLARRIDDVRSGRDPGPLDAWMEEVVRDTRTKSYKDISHQRSVGYFQRFDRV